VAAPFGFDFSAVERAVAQYVDGRVRVLPASGRWSGLCLRPTCGLCLRDRQPVREGDQIVAYSIDRLSIEEPLSKFGEALRGRNFDEMKKDSA
jgi:hypothetical protein